jgi:lipid A disaccharide synthetase
VQHDFTAENVVTRLQQVLPDGAARERMLQGMANVKAKLRVSESVEGNIMRTPAERAAEIILSIGNCKKMSSD